MNRESFFFRLKHTSEPQRTSFKRHLLLAPKFEKNWKEEKKNQNIVPRHSGISRFQTQVQKRKQTSNSCDPILLPESPTARRNGLVVTTVDLLDCHLMMMDGTGAGVHILAPGTPVNSTVHTLREMNCGGLYRRYRRRAHWLRLPTGAAGTDRYRPRTRCQRGGYPHATITGPRNAQTRKKVFSRASYSTVLYKPLQRTRPRTAKKKCFINAQPTKKQPRNATCVGSAVDRKPVQPTMTRGKATRS